MPRRDRLSATRFAARSDTALVNREGDIVFTSANSLQTPDELQPDHLHRTGEVERGDTQLNLRVDKIKQRLLQVLALLLRSHAGSVAHPRPCCALQCSPRSKKSKTQTYSAKSGGHSRHHFCVERSDNSTLPQQADSEHSVLNSASTGPADRQSPIPSEQHQAYCESPSSTQASAQGSPADQTYHSHTMTSVNKLLAELAHKRQECRKIKQQATVGFLVGYTSSKPPCPSLTYVCLLR